MNFCYGQYDFKVFQGFIYFTNLVCTMKFLKYKSLEKISSYMLCDFVF